MSDPNTGNFAGSVAIVTGAGSGIGAATVDLLAQAGLDVIAADINLDAVESVSKAARDQGLSVEPFRADVADPGDSEALVNFARERFGALHYAVNNVALSAPGDSISEMSVDLWRKAIDVSLSGTFYGLRHEIPAIAEAGGGAIVNVSSIAGLRGTVNNSAYVTAKHGLIGLTKAAAMECAPLGVRVNAVSPGYIATPRVSGISADRLDALAATTPLKRLGKAVEIADGIVHLLSDRASYMTGATQVIDGGFTAGYGGASAAR